MAILALVFSGMVAVAPPAQAALYNPIPMSSESEPTYDFVDDDALFAYVTSDIKGGRVCIVRASVQTPGAASCEAPAWGSPNALVGVGSIISLIEAPTLKPGSWKLLTVNSEGESVALSETFTVTACPDCSREFALERVAQWKAMAAGMRTAYGSTCAAFGVKDAVDAVTAARGKIGAATGRADAYQAGDLGFAATISTSAGGLLGLAFGFPALTDAIGAGADKALQILHDLSCAAGTMYQNIVDDPPDPAFDSVADPTFTSLPDTESDSLDALLVAIDRQTAHAEAALTAFERYLGAEEAGDNEASAIQAQAASDQTFAQIAEMRRTSSALREHASELETLETFADPIATAAEWADIAAIYERVSTGGFTNDERAQMIAAGLTDEEIAAIRTHFEIPLGSVDPARSLVEAMRQAAITTDAQIEGFDAFAREAAAVAARRALDMDNQPPIARDDAASVTAGATDQVFVLANDEDPDGDLLTITSASTPVAGGTVDCTAGSYCLFTAPSSPGLDSFTYTVSDAAGKSDSATVTITVKAVGELPPPPDASDDTLTLAVGQQSVVYVTANDPRVPVGGGAQEWTDPVAGGTVDCTFFGWCTYAAPAQPGVDSFTYTLRDAYGRSDTATVTVNVMAAMAAPPPNECVTYPGFPDSLGMTLGGGAGTVESVLRLTPNTGYSKGRAWTTHKVAVGEGFQTEFVFRMIAPGGISGADGLTFAIQNHGADAEPEIGAYGGYLGYSDIPNSLVVEFDTFNNGALLSDPDNNHVAVHSGGTGPNKPADPSSFLGSASLGPNIVLADGKLHRARITYSTSDGGIRVFVDDMTTPKLTVPVDLASLLELDAGSAWVGFTAATGAGYQNHDIRDWTICPTASSADLAITMAAAPNPVSVGANLNLDIEVENVGQADVDTALITVDLPSSVTLLSSDTCTNSARTLTCSIGPLAAGSTTSRQIVLVPTAPNPSLTTTARVSSGTDPIPENNLAVATVAVSAGGIPNGPPVVDAGGPVSGVEGAAVALGGSASDPDQDALTVDWSYQPGPGVDAGATCSFADPEKASTSITCTDDGTYQATLSADDATNEPVSTTATVTISNAAPVVTITSPTDGATVAVGQPVTVTAPITDAGANDTHTCSVDFGDGTVLDGTVSQGTCSANHTYPQPGAVGITVTATDDDTATGVAEVILVIAERDSKVTGGGFITTDGRTSFGLVAKPGSPAPLGEVQIRSGSNRFHGHSLTSLAAAGKSATITGIGEWNGADGFTFTINVADNQTSGSRKKGVPDQISIVIRDPAGEVRFSRSGPLRGGDLTVHK